MLDDIVENETYKSKLDFERFKQLLAQADEDMDRERKELSLGHRSRGLSHNMSDKLLEELASKLGVTSRQGHFLQCVSREIFFQL